LVKIKLIDTLVLFEVVRLWLKATCCKLFFVAASRLFQESDIKYFNSKQHFVHNYFPDAVLVLRSKLTCLAFATQHCWPLIKPKMMPV